MLTGLNVRGMHGGRLVVSDSHGGFKVVREAMLMGVPWQRFQMHLRLNTQTYGTKAPLKNEVAADIHLVSTPHCKEDVGHILA